MEAGIFSPLSQLRFPGVGATRLDISARHAVHLIDPRKALPPGPKLAVRMSALSGFLAAAPWDQKDEARQERRQFCLAPCPCLAEHYL